MLMHQCPDCDAPCDCFAGSRRVTKCVHECPEEVCDETCAECYGDDDDEYF